MELEEVLLGDQRWGAVVAPGPSVGSRSEAASAMKIQVHGRGQDYVVPHTHTHIHTHTHNKINKKTWSQFRTLAAWLFAAQAGNGR